MFVSILRAKVSLSALFWIASLKRQVRCLIGRTVCRSNACQWAYGKQTMITEDQNVNWWFEWGEENVPSGLHFLSQSCPFAVVQFSSSSFSPFLHFYKMLCPAVVLSVCWSIQSKSVKARFWDTTVALACVGWWGAEGWGLDTSAHLSATILWPRTSLVISMTRPHFL